MIPDEKQMKWRETRDVERSELRTSATENALLRRRAKKGLKEKKIKLKKKTTNSWTDKLSGMFLYRDERGG